MLSTALRTPFIDPNIFFAQIGSEVIDPVSRLLRDEMVVLKGGESLKWKEEYSRGRIAGREALGYAGASVGSAILRGQSGEPLFPEGYVGSISHSLGIGVACASSTSFYKGLGIDIENFKKKRQAGIFKKIATEGEQAWIFEVQDEQEVLRRGVLIFSIKESIYKAMYQAFKVRLKYMDAEVFPVLDGGEASVSILKEGFESAKIISGFGFYEGLVVSGVGVRN